MLHRIKEQDANYILLSFIGNSKNNLCIESISKILRCAKTLGVNLHFRKKLLHKTNLK